MDEALKKRLLGAIALLAIAVILWPLAFDSAEQIKLSKESQIPPKPDVARWKPVKVPAPDSSGVGWPDENIASTANSPQASPAKPPANRPQLKPAVDAVAAAQKPVVDPDAPARAEQSAAFRPAWVVQVASLSERNSAEQLVQRLRADNYRAYSEVAERDGKQSFRVLVGPKFDKRTAVSIKQEIDKSLKVDSLVLSFRPE